MPVGAFWALCFLVNAAVFTVVRPEPVDPVLLIASLGLLYPLSVALHEVGHLVAGKAVGYQVKAIELGDHGTFQQFHIGSLRVSIMQGWYRCGRVHLGSPKTDDYRRTRSIFVYIAGLATNLGCALLFPTLFSTWGADHMTASLWLIFITLCFFSAQQTLGTGGPPGDIDLALQTLSSPEPTASETKAARLLEEERFTEAYDVLFSAMSDDVEPPWKEVLALAQVDGLTGEFARSRRNCEKAMDLFLDGRSQDSIDLRRSQDLESLLIAYASVLLLEGKDVEDALQLAETLNLNRRSANSCVLLGVALILNGREIPAARVMLEYADSMGYNGPNRFEVQRILAIASFVEGDVDEGRACVERARAIYPQRSDRVDDVEEISAQIQARMPEQAEPGVNTLRPAVAQEIEEIF